MLKFYSSYDFGGSGSSIYWLTHAGMKHVHLPNEADIIVFNGGSDIATEIYNETPAYVGIPQFMSKRDEVEVQLFKDFKGQKFMLGICRGAQLLNCLNGGTLWQDVNGHRTNHHMIDLITGETLMVTSEHHQMMRPAKHADIIGLSSESTVKQNARVTESFIPVDDLTKNAQDVEICWYEDTRSLCIQGHPEWAVGSRFDDYCVHLVRNLAMGGELNKARVA